MPGAPLEPAETALWVVAFLLASVTATVVSARAGRGWINPLSVYLAVWSGLVLVIAIHLVDVERLHRTTWIMVSTAALAFAVGCLVAWGLSGRRAPEPEPAAYDPGRLDRLYRLGVVALAAYVVLQVAKVYPLFRASGGFGSLLSGGGLAFRRAQLAAAAENATTSFTGGSFLVGALGYLLFVSLITVFWAAYYARRGAWGRALVPLALVAAYSLFALQRFFFVYSLLLFACSFVYHARWTRPIDWRRPPRPLLVLAGLALLVVFVPIVLRQPASSSEQPLGTPPEYFAGGLAGLDTLVAGSLPGPAPQPGYGVWTLYGIATLLSRLGADLAIPVTSSLPFVDVGEAHRIENNVYTYLVYGLYDFGPPGLVILPFALGLAGAWLHEQVRRWGRLEAVPLASVALTSIVMSFFGLSLVRDTRWIFLVVAAAALTPRLLAGDAAQRPGGAAARRLRPLDATQRRGP
jgi:oligosaccharide repeat unit polymerase